MTDIGKFISDVSRILKHDRQEHGGKSDYNRCSKDLGNLFERAASCPRTLAGSVFDYWENQYIFNSTKLAEEPTDENTAKLAAFLAFLDNSDEDRDLISDDDWQELGRLVNYEAEDLPLDILQDLMTVLVSKGAY